MHTSVTTDGLTSVTYTIRCLTGCSTSKFEQCYYSHGTAKSESAFLNGGGGGGGGTTWNRVSHWMRFTFSGQSSSTNCMQSLTGHVIIPVLKVTNSLHWCLHVFVCRWFDGWRRQERRRKPSAIQTRPRKRRFSRWNSVYYFLPFLRLFASEGAFFRGGGGGGGSISCLQLRSLLFTRLDTPAWQKIAGFASNCLCKMGL